MSVNFLQSFLSPLKLFMIELYVHLGANGKRFLFLPKERVFNMRLLIKIKDYGNISLELDEKNAPITVKNFIDLVEKRFYNGLIFHRVIKGFMIQGGDPKGNGTGGPGYTIKGEFKANGVENPISHKRGVISMARSQKPDSAGSQFFIMHKDGVFLDGNYAAFGHVISGIEVVDAIAQVRTTPNDKPVVPIIIETIEVID
jgi:peptidyl-prolyl cis-trans isomerase B (cyclophilin B)